MSFVTKYRGAGGGPIVAEYECPAHGRFEATIARDEHGDPPADAPCPYDLADDEPERAGQPGARRLCLASSPWRISAPRVKVRFVEVVRGGYQKPERETWTDTTSLGEGQSLEDWKADRAKVWERDREADVMALKKELG